MSDIEGSSELGSPYMLNEEEDSSNVDTLEPKSDSHTPDNYHDYLQASPNVVYHQFSPVPNWNVSSSAHPIRTLSSDTFSPIISPIVARSQPITSFPTSYPYSYPTARVNYALPGATAYSSYLKNPDAEVSYYSWLSRDENETGRRSPGIDCNTATPSPVSTGSTETLTELDHCQNDFDSVKTNKMSSLIMSKRLKMSVKRNASHKGNFPYKRHAKPPYLFRGIITTVIQNSPEQRLTLNQICDRMYELFECFRKPYQGWRDSVRHNLSYNACFVKEEVADTPREDKKRSHYWIVDLEKVPIGAFCIQRTDEARSGTYKNHIHEELGLPQIHLPGAKNGVECRCTQSLNALTKRSANQLLKIYREQLGTPAPQTSDVTRLQLPVMDKCNLPTASPEVYRARDVFNTSFLSDCQPQRELGFVATVNSAKTTVASDSGVQHSALFAHERDEPEMNFQSISQYIMSTEGIHGPTNAVENLSFLCFNTTNE